MTLINHNHFTELKNNISEFFELSNFQFFLIQQLSKTQQIEVILLYDQILQKISDLIEYNHLTTNQKTLLQKISPEKRIELIKIYNETFKDINQIN